MVQQQSQLQTSGSGAKSVHLMQMRHASWGWLCCAPACAIRCDSVGMCLGALEYCPAVEATFVYCTCTSNKWHGCCCCTWHVVS
jgi:hypothetical protein